LFRALALLPSRSTARSVVLLLGLSLVVLFAGTRSSASADDGPPTLRADPPESSVPLPALGEQPQPPAPDAPIPLAPLDLLDGTIEGINIDEDGTNNSLWIGSIPPDPIGAAGRADLVSVVNTSIEVHSKTGTQRASQSLASLFSPLTPLSLFDPKVIYDQFADRFVVVVLDATEVSAGDPSDTSRILLAASDDDDPMGTWYLHAVDSVVSIGETDHWADYPGFAVDEEAIYITANMFPFGAGLMGGTRLWIVDKAALYANGSPAVTVHDPQVETGLTAAIGGGILVMQPAHVFGTAPGGLGTFLVMYGGLSDGVDEALAVLRVDDPLGSPVFAAYQFVELDNVDDTSAAMPDAPQQGTAELIETNDRRSLHAVWRDNSLWMTTTVVPPSGDDAGQATAHWVEIDTSDVDALSLADQGSVGGNDIDTDAYTFMPSIAVDADGNVGIGFALSSPSDYAGAYYTGRRASDPAGTVRATKTLAAGQGPYLRTFSGTRNRWGDYSGMALDPVDEVTFWVFNEYALTQGLTDANLHDGRWGTKWGSFSLYDPPDAPTSVVAVPGNQQATVSWTAPASDGGSAITLYIVTSNPGALSATSTVTSATVTGLTNGNSYTFTVTATNPVGTSASSSASNGVTPATVPGPPTGVAAVGGNAQATVSWTAPASDGGSAITSYTATSNPGGLTGTAGGSATSTSVTGLTNGTSYTFTVTATNPVGTSTPSSASNAVTPMTLPDAPTSVAAVAGNQQATVSWAAPASDGGSSITLYTVTSDPGAISATSTVPSAAVTGLTNGTSYTFTVTATNSVGASTPSSPSNAITPATVPDAPTNVTAAPGDQQATVSWTAPASDGGSPITGYTATSNPGGMTGVAGGSATSTTVTGLTNSTPYTFVVTATNSVGAGPSSSSSTPVIPAAVPGAPTDVVAAIGIGPGQVIVSWTPPSSDGGSAITGYTATSNPGGLTGVAGGSATSTTVSGLTGGVEYTFTVTAANIIGTSASSSPSNPVTPANVPDPPTDVTAMAGKGEAFVSWTAPASDGGSPVLQYIVTSAPGGISATSTATTATVEGLTNGTPYTFTVTATNITGTSASSTPSSAATPFASVAGLTAYPFMRLHRDSSDYSGTEAWDGDSEDGATGVIMGIDEVRDGGGNPVAPLLAGYEAELRYDGLCINILEIRAGRDFAGVVSNIDNTLGVASLIATNVSGDRPDSNMAFAVVRLVGDATTACNLEVVFTNLIDVDAGAISATSTQVIAEFKRGDVLEDGALNVGDAPFLAQYLVGVRPGGTAMKPPGGPGDLTCMNSVNAVDVIPDGVINVGDLLFLKQRLVGLRDDAFQ